MVELFLCKTTSNKSQIEVCLLTTRLLSCVKGMWSSSSTLTPDIVYLVHQENFLTAVEADHSQILRLSGRKKLATDHQYQATMSPF